MPLAAINIDPCILTLPGSGTIQYISIDEIDPTTYEPAIKDSTYNLQKSAGVASWYTLPMAPGSGEFAEDEQDGDQGKHYRVNVSAFMPSDATAVRGELQRMRNRRFLLRLTKGSLVLLLGTPERPLRIASEFKSGNDGGDNRGHRISFTGVSLAKSPGFVPVF